MIEYVRASFAAVYNPEDLDHITFDVFDMGGGACDVSCNPVDLYRVIVKDELGELEVRFSDLCSLSERLDTRDIDIAELRSENYGCSTCGMSRNILTFYVRFPR